MNLIYNRWLKVLLEQTQINTVGKFLTAQLVSCSRQQVVEDVEAPLIFSLTNSSRLLQQIWWHVSQEERPQKTRKTMRLVQHLRDMH